MKILGKYVLKEHLYPFFLALIVLLFVILTNFLLRSLDKFLGKGLEFSLIVEYVFLNLAWILALAVPMAVLIATLMAFGRLASDNEIVAMRSVSVSYFNLLLPVIIFGMSITIIMMYFNNQILPDMNHKARLLSSDISKKRPDLDFEVGYFIETIPNYTFLLGERNGEIFKDITIFKNIKNQQKQTIISETGTISTVNDGVFLHLLNGVIHEYLGNEKNEYREIYFDKHIVMIPIDNMSLKRRDSSIRGDREMTYDMMKDKIADYEKKKSFTQARIVNRLISEGKKIDFDFKIDSTALMTPLQVKKVISNYKLVLEDSIIQSMGVSTSRINRRINKLEKGIKSDFILIKSYSNSINKYLVELHKKFSIPFASIVFILIGAPLGMMARKGGFAVSMAFSLGFFIIYWIFLISGEEFADRGFLSPALSMWLPNLVLGPLGLFMCYWHSQEQKLKKIRLPNLFYLHKRNIS